MPNQQINLTPHVAVPTAETAAGIIPDHSHPKIRQLFNYWGSIHPAEGLPGRQHFDPVDIPLLLPSVFLVDTPPSGDFIVRVMGTRLDEFFGGNFTGKPFANAFIKGHESQTYIDMCAILLDRQPRWRKGLASFVENREHITTERLFLPLSRPKSAMLSFIKSGLGRAWTLALAASALFVQVA